MEYICFITRVSNAKELALSLRAHFSWTLKYTAGFLRMLQKLTTGTHEPIVLNNAVPMWEPQIERLKDRIGNSAELITIRVVDQYQLKKEQEEKEFHQLREQADAWLRNADEETKKWVRILTCHQCSCMPTA